MLRFCFQSRCRGLPTVTRIIRKSGAAPRIFVSRFCTTKPESSIRTLLQDSTIFLPSHDTKVNKSRAALRNQIIALRSKGPTAVIGAIVAAVLPDLATSDATWRDRVSMLLAGFLTTQEVCGSLSALVRAARGPEKAALIQLISLLMKIWSGATDLDKAVCVLGSLPISSVPDYSIDIEENDIVWSNWIKWKDTQDKREEGCLSAAEIAGLARELMHDDVSSESVVKLMKQIVFKFWFRSILDPVLALHHSNVLISCLIASIDPSPTNRSIAVLTQSWNDALLVALKLPENKKVQKLLDARGYLGWLSLLIAEIAKRRGIHHHDIFLIKELLDKTMNGWNPDDVQVCAQLIDRKFSYFKYWKAKIGGMFK